MKSRPLAPEPGSQRLLPSTGAVPVLLDGHLDRHGPLPYLQVSGNGALAEVIQESGLIARDGSARPVDLDPAEPGEPVIATTSARKDRALIWLVPHLVLDGVQLVAAACGTRRNYVETGGRGAENLRAMLDSELAARADAWIDAAPVMPTETADLSGGRRIDAETLAHIALIARYGAQWFRSMGSAERPGTELLEMREPDGRLDVIEVPGGTRVPPLARVRAERC
jgi:hypothetical protein